MRDTRLRRALLALALAGFAAFACAGCGGGASDPVARAADTTAAMPGADFSLAASVQVGGLPQSVTFTGSGTENIRTRRVALTIDLSRIIAAAHVKGVDPATARMNGVFAYPWFYISAPALFRGLPQGKRWVGVDVERVGQAQGIGQLGQFNQSDPSQYLESLKATSGNVRRVGSEQVRGVPTTHYTATVDLRKLPDRLPPAQRANARRTADRLAQVTGRSTYPVEVWIDSRNVVRRERVTLSLKGNQGTGAPPTSFSETIEFFNFGPKPAIAAPPASEVLDLTQLAAQRGR